MGIQHVANPHCLPPPHNARLHAHHRRPTGRQNMGHGKWPRLPPLPGSQWADLHAFVLAGGDLRRRLAVAHVPVPGPQQRRVHGSGNPAQPCLQSVHGQRSPVLVPRSLVVAEHRGLRRLGPLDAVVPSAGPGVRRPLHKGSRGWDCTFPLKRGHCHGRAGDPLWIGKIPGVVVERHNHIQHLVEPSVAQVGARVEVLRNSA
mmetsp:Transcript_58118/g.155352  ORF Transcript_58118/g.155352 Transcript_58118/m.155352 type:complete len:202 (+) Transcript_58118:348-953(+)